MPVNDIVAEENSETKDTIPDDDTQNLMLEGFEGNREPLPFDQELQEEEKYFGKIDNEEQIDTEEQPVIEKRSSIESEEEEEQEVQSSDNDLIEDDGTYAEEVDETEDSDVYIHLFRTLKVTRIPTVF